MFIHNGFNVSLQPWVILAVAIFCIIVIKLSRILCFPEVTLGMFLYFAQLLSGFGLQLLLLICLTTRGPLPKQLVCCPNLWGCQALSFWAPSDPGKRYTGLRQHTLATINQNINKNNETSLYIEKLGGKILNVDKSKFMKCLVPYGYVLYWYLLVMCRV